MADMIQKGASAGNTGRAHSKGQVSNTITHLKTYMNLEMGVGSLDVTSNGLGLIQKDTNNGMSVILHPNIFQKILHNTKGNMAGREHSKQAGEQNFKLHP